jgi:hypothetical protein
LNLINSGLCTDKLQPSGSFPAVVLRGEWK